MLISTASNPQTITASATPSRRPGKIPNHPTTGTAPYSTCPQRLGSEGESYATDIPLYSQNRHGKTWLACKG